MRVNEALVQRIIQAYIDEPVKVEWGDIDGAYGEANYDHDGFVIKLAPCLLQHKWQELGETLIHEVGHIVLGHVPRKVRTGRTYDMNQAERAKATGTADPALMDRLLSIMREREVEVSAWTRAALALWESNSYRGLSRDLLDPAGAGDRRRLGEEMPVTYFPKRN